jgi:hypothetical protein
MRHNIYRDTYAEFVSANILSVRLIHNGLQGGDSGHGGFVEVQFKDIASTFMELNDKEVSAFKIRFQGDTERSTFLDALKFIVKELEENY